MWKESLILYKHCMKNVRIRSFSGPHFPAFGLNTERYSVSLRIQSECGKMQTRISPNTDSFHAVIAIMKIRQWMRIKWCKTHNSWWFFLKGGYTLLVNSCLYPYCGNICKIGMEYCKVNCSQYVFIYVIS